MNGIILGFTTCNICPLPPLYPFCSLIFPFLNSLISELWKIQFKCFAWCLEALYQRNTSEVTLQSLSYVSNSIAERDSWRCLRNPNISWVKRTKTALLQLLKGHQVSRHLGPSVPFVPALNESGKSFSCPLKWLKKIPLPYKKFKPCFFPSWPTQLKVICMKLFSLSAILLPIFLLMSL